MGISHIGPARKMLAGVAFVSMLIGCTGATAPRQSQSSVDLSQASVEKIRTHILDSCVLREWGRTEASKKSYSERCNCYARRITADMNSEELDAFRQTGVFNASARPKAEAAQHKCNLQSY